MKIAICDDDENFLEDLHQTLSSLGTAIPNADIREFADGIRLIGEYEKNRRFDIVFLDIEMPGLSGLETGREIRAFDKDAIIIFLTNHSQFVFESFDIGTFGYLVKPVDTDALDKTLDRALKKYREQHYIVTFQWNGIAQNLRASEIVYIDSFQRKAVFHTYDKQTYMTVSKLDAYEIKLASHGFLRCHKSCLINMNYIGAFGKRKIQTTTGVEVDMSASKKEYCLKAFSDFIARRRI